MLSSVRSNLALAIVVAAGMVTLAILSGSRLSTQAIRVGHFVHAHAASDPRVAYGYGDMHFTSMEKEWYDVDAAEYFYRLAHSRDPKLPFVNHQLARIEFLRSNYLDGLILINRELEVNPEPSPSSYYIRGLIEGFAGMYDLAAKDYEHYLTLDPTNWAAINDYAWVLLKAGRSQEALDATTRGLGYFPHNPWLLNSNAIALYEEGRLDEARVQVRLALETALALTEEEWLIAYPGNDPRIAQDGLHALGDSVRKNARMIRGDEDVR